MKVTPVTDWYVYNEREQENCVIVANQVTLNSPGTTEKSW